MLEHGMLKAPANVFVPKAVDVFGDGSCKAFYRLDGNANDESGLYHGTETVVGAWAGGAYERGWYHEGNGKYISTTYNPNSTNWAISGFIFPVNTGTSDICIVLGVATVQTFGVYYSTNQAYLVLNGVAETLNLVGTKVNNTWNHFTISCSNNVCTVYMNAVATTSALASTLWNNNLTIGLSGYSYNYGDIIVDHLRIFNRPLTLAEVTQLSTEAKPTSIVLNTNPFGDASCMALYRFENNVLDDLGVYNGTATAITYGAGKFGQCALFNGTSSGIDLPNIAAKTISIWFKANSTGIQWLYEGRKTGCMGLGIAFGVVTSQQITVTDGTGNKYTYAMALPLNILHNVIVSISGTTGYLYINGGFIASFALTFDYTLAIHKLGNYGASNFLNGGIDSVRFFNKYITPMEAACLYNETTPLEEPLHSLVDPFKDGSGITLYRLDGNTNDESGQFNGTGANLTYGTSTLGGRCALFNGVSSGLDYPAIAVKTISIWFKSSSTGVQLLYEGRKSGCAGFGIFFGVVTAQQVTITDGTGNKYTYAVTLALNTMHHVIASLSGTTLSLYVNGTFITSFVITPDYTLAIHRSGNYGASYYLSGGIDQVRFFNRALIQAEVTQLYTNQA